MAKESFINILESLFISLGFSEKEARVYRVMLEIGQGPATTIITKADLKKGITYAVLKNLEKRGLVSSFGKEGKTYFRAEDPQKLLDLVEEKKREVDSLRNSLSEIVPKLTSQYKLAIGKPTIRYFEGKEGLVKVFEDIYGPGKEIVWGCVDLEKSDEAFPAYILKDLIPKRIKNKVIAKSFVADSPQAHQIAKKDKEQLRQTILVNKNDYPLPAEIDVYEDKIALLSFKKGEFIGLLIENPEFAESLRSIFKIAFKLARVRKKL